MSIDWKWTIPAILLAFHVPPAAADVITDWNEKAIAWVTPRMTPPMAQRAVAIVQVAMFDAVNSIDRRYRPYLTQLPVAASTSREAAAATAASVALRSLVPAVEGEINAAATAYLAAIADGDDKAAGIKLGDAVAVAILEARGKDGANAPDAYRPKTTPGVYVPTPITVGSMLPNTKPFALTSPAQFRPAAPISLKSQQWAADYNEIKELGAKASTKRSARQTEDARFWLITGPQSTDPIARQLVKNMSVIDSARFMAVAAVALADAYIAVMDAKYQYEFWRPITAIRNGDSDDNPATERDAAWQPIDNTPMHPEYPCAHCIGSAALATAAEAMLGTARVDVAMTSSTMPGVTHRWTDLQAYTDEVSQARIWAGFHYRFSAQVGQDMGRKIGRHVVDTVMQPAVVADAR